MRDDLNFWGDPAYSNDCSFVIPQGDTETWCAWTSSQSQFGIGLYVPGIAQFFAGRYEYDGSKSPKAASTNYVAPIIFTALQSYQPLSYTYQITTGSVEQIREVFYENRAVDQVLTPVDDSQIVIDRENGFLYGLRPGFTANELKAQFANDAGCISVLGGDRVATCCIVQLSDAENAGLIRDSLIVVLFGDVTGDGWYDGTDAYVVRLIANGMVSADALTAAQRMAADCNHDGVIDFADASLLEQAGLLLANVSQTAASDELTVNGAFIEYCSLIDQSIDAGEPVPDRSPETTAGQGRFMERILGFIHSVFIFFFNLLFLKTS